MLYLFHGSDALKGREELSAFLAGCRRMAKDVSVVRVAAEAVTKERLRELTRTQGLFTNAVVVVLDLPFELKEVKDFVLEEVGEMANSANTFVVFEGSLDKKTLATFNRHAEKIIFYGEQRVLSREPFNRFALTDALLKRDRKALWVLFERARRESVSEEEMHGILFWQVKSMLLSRDAKGAAETGLKPFVFSKSKGGALRFKEGELQKLSSDLVTLYHEARRGRCDLGAALEQWVLSV